MADHDHGAESDADATPGSRSLPILISIGLIALIALLPNLGPTVVAPGGPVEAVHGRIESIASPPPDESFAAPIAIVTLLEGDRTGQSVEAHLEGPGGSQVVAAYEPGDEVVVTFTQDPSGQPYVSVGERWRLPFLGVLGLLFAAAVVLIGGWQGLRALLALGLTMAVVLKILLPLVISGAPPVPLAVVTATFVTVTTILLTEGLSRRSTAAILGVAAALSLTGLLSIITTAFAQFTYSAGSDLAFLRTAGGTGLDLRGMLLAAFILGAVGVLDDVTVTQAAVVDSLAARGASGETLVAESMGIGRSHIAATVNTLFLAYLGAGLPLLVVLLVSQQPAGLVLNAEDIAVEIVRAIVGSLGIIAAVPLTTMFAVALVTRAPRQAGMRQRRISARAAFIGVSVAVIALALVGTALVPLGAPARPLSADLFDPAALPTIPDELFPSDEPFPSDAASEPPPDEPELIEPGDVVTVDTPGATLELTVISIDARTVAGGTRVRVDVEYRNEGPDSYAVDPAEWSVIGADGSERGLEPTSSGGLQTTAIAAGAALAGKLQATLKRTADAFVIFTTVDGSVPLAIKVPPADSLTDP